MSNLEGSGSQKSGSNVALSKTEWVRCVILIPNMEYHQPTPAIEALKESSSPFLPATVLTLYALYIMLR
jgi:hypothetical protein